MQITQLVKGGERVKYDLGPFNCTISCESFNRTIEEFIVVTCSDMQMSRIKAMQFSLRLADCLAFLRTVITDC